MDIRLTVVGDGAVDGLLQLRGLLGCEPDLRGRVSLVEKAPREGELGSLPDTLAIALGAQGTITVLAASLRTLFARPRRSDYHVVLTLPDGTRIEVDAKRIDELDIAELIRQTKGATQ